MPQCPSCGFNNKDAIKCTQCGRYFSKAMEIISTEAEQEELETFEGRWKRILQSGDIKNQAFTELQQFKESLTLNLKGKFTLYVIVAFVFFITLAVL